MYWLDSLFWWVGALTCGMGVVLAISLICTVPLALAIHFLNIGKPIQVLYEVIAMRQWPKEVPEPTVEVKP